MSGRSVLVRGGVDAVGRPCDVLVIGGLVAATGPSVQADASTSVLDATGLVFAPGLIDLQVNGAAGVDVTAEPHRIADVGAALVRHGVTAFLPTVITSPAEARSAAIGALGGLSPRGPAGAVPLGLHFEGPMIARAARGAHPQRWLTDPSLALVDGWSADGGVAMVTIAPELPGATEVIEELVGRGIVVSLGHTAATTAQVRAGVDAGASCLTHLYNAMPPLHHREPGPVGVALGGEQLIAGVIADGHHMDPLALNVAWRLLGPGRFLSVSDTTAALGAPDGDAVLGGQAVVVGDGTVRLPDGTLAGSAASLADCLGVLIETTGCSLSDALATATTTPAKVLRDGTRGRLDVGCRGDLVLLDPAAGPFAVVTTVVGGEVVYDARSPEPSSPAARHPASGVGVSPDGG